MMVVAELTKMGIPVMLPITHAVPYDLVVQNGDGELKSIQVRTAYLPTRGVHLCCETRRLTTSRSKASTAKARQHLKGSYDYLVAVAIESGVFWIIPEEVVCRYKSAIYLSREISEMYEGAWELI